MLPSAGINGGGRRAPGSQDRAGHNSERPAAGAHRVGLSSRSAGASCLRHLARLKGSKENTQEVTLETAPPHPHQAASTPSVPPAPHTNGSRKDPDAHAPGEPRPQGARGVLLPCC